MGCPIHFYRLENTSDIVKYKIRNQKGCLTEIIKYDVYVILIMGF